MRFIFVQVVLYPFNIITWRFQLETFYLFLAEEQINWNRIAQRRHQVNYTDKIVHNRNVPL